MFKLDLMPSLNLQRVDDPILGRVYNTPVGPLKSVTTILSERIPNPGIDAWKLRVGLDEANRISNQASARGSIIHTACEKYLLGKDWKAKMMPTNVATFQQIRPILDTSVDTIKGIEFGLYSRHLKAAGTTDLIADFNKKLSIIDIKTSKWVKEESQILSYFLQTCAYSIMLEELYGMSATQLVIIMTIDHEQPRVFCVPRNKYLEQTIDLFRGHYDKKL